MDPQSPDPRDPSVAQLPQSADALGDRELQDDRGFIGFEDSENIEINPENPPVRVICSPCDPAAQEIEAHKAAGHTISSLVPSLCCSCGTRGGPRPAGEGSP